MKLGGIALASLLALVSDRALAEEARFDLAVGEVEETADPDSEPLVRGGIDDRPYLARLRGGPASVALGGYLDVLGQYQAVEGVDEGWSFEARRFNLFVTSQIAHAVRLTSELEFEHGTEEIALETALVDLLFHHAINLRAGILLVPIGKFNLAHDAPLHDLVDRPLVSTQIIPSTLSEAGAGLFGSLYPAGRHRITYELYAVNGLGEGVIAADGTRLPNGKSEEAFAEDENGVPSIAGRVAYQSPSGGFARGEVGFSGYAGVYNVFRIEGETVDRARWLRILALDGELALGPVTVKGEGAVAHVDLPPATSQLHTQQQVGFYLDADWVFLKTALGPFDDASLAVAARVDWVDRFVGTISDDGASAGDETLRLSGGPSFRPAPGTAVRLIYHHDFERDPLDNPTRAAGVQLGIATYF